MKERKKIIRHYVGILLTLIFLFPSLLQFEHLFDNHKHPVCKENTVHFHEKPLDCSIYDFHYSVFGFQPHFQEEYQLNIPSFTPAISFLAALYKDPNYSYSLRGPPVIVDFTI